MKSGSDQGLQIANMIKEGKIVPAETTIRLLKAALESREVTLSYTLKHVSTRTDRSGRRRSFIILLFIRGRTSSTVSRAQSTTSKSTNARSAPRPRRSSLTYRRRVDHSDSPTVKHALLVW